MKRTDIQYMYAYPQLRFTVGLFVHTGIVHTCIDIRISMHATLYIIFITMYYILLHTVLYAIV